MQDHSHALVHVYNAHTNKRMV